LREQSAPGGTLCSISPYSPYGASPSMSHMPGQERVHDTSLAQLPEVTLTAASTQSSCGGGQEASRVGHAEGEVQILKPELP